MSITVEKSSDITMDSTMNKALEVVMDQLNKQSEHVKSVTLLANFSIDNEAALLNKLPVVVQGLVVQLTKDYKFSPEDASWFHPDVARGRSIFSLENSVAKSVLQSLALENGNNSVGSYQLSSIDEFGCEQIQNRLVVNTSAKNLLTTKYNEWLQTGVTAGELDTQWKRMHFENNDSIVKKAEVLRNEIAQGVSKSAVLIHSDITHSVLSDLQSVYIANAAVRASAQILMKSSALGGYRIYNGGKTDRKFFPSNLGIAPTFYAWTDLSAQNCQRIINTCSWNGELAWNAQVMQPPAVKNIKAMEESLNITLRDTLQMRHCAFSASDEISDCLAPTDVLKLTPTAEQSPNASPFITSPLNMQHPVMQNLMNNIESVQSKFVDFKLFNPKYVSNGHLNIPREIYKHIL
mgnify:CR=1 FL=1